MTGWSAESVVLVITALGTMAVSIIAAIQAGRAKTTASEVHEKVKKSGEKIEIIEQHTNGMNTVLENTVKNLAEELKALRAENLAAMTGERNIAQAKIEAQSADIVRRADAAVPAKEKE